MYSPLLVSVIFSLLALNGAFAIVCTDDSQCASNECCQIMSEFMIVSRRDIAPFTIMPKPTRSGTCEPYSYEGDNCNSFAKANGYCSCAPGLSCQGKEVLVGTPQPTAILPTAILRTKNKRSMIPPRPGYTWEFKCRKI